MNEVFDFARSQNINVKFKPLKYNDGRHVCCNGEYRIAIAEDLKTDEVKATYILAHELAHHYLHKDKGDTINSPNHAAYEEQADRAAFMLLDFILFQQNNKALTMLGLNDKQWRK